MVAVGVLTLCNSATALAVSNLQQVVLIGHEKFEGKIMDADAALKNWNLYSDVKEVWELFTKMSNKEKLAVIETMMENSKNATVVDRDRSLELMDLGGEYLEAILGSKMDQSWAKTMDQHLVEIFKKYRS